MKPKEITSVCEICGRGFITISHGNPPRKTCGKSCRAELRRINGGFQFNKLPDDPSPDEIIRRARIIRQINEKNKRNDQGRPRILSNELDWYK